MAGIHAAAFPPAEQWPAPAFAELLALPGVYGLVDPAGGLILARTAVDEAEILTFAVTPDVQRRGVGRGLLRAAMEIAGSRGAASVFLEVSARNRPALALYAAAGFAECGRRLRYYSDGADALVLRATLSPA